MTSRRCHIRKRTFRTVWRLLQLLCQRSMDDASAQTLNLCPAEQWHFPQAVLETRLIASAMWEGSDRTQKEVQDLLNSLRKWLPFLPQRQEREEGLVDTHPKARQRSLRAALQAASVVDGVNVWRTRLLSSVSVIQFGGVATAALSCLSPQVSPNVLRPAIASYERLHQLSLLILIASSGVSSIMRVFTTVAAQVPASGLLFSACKVTGIR